MLYSLLRYMDQQAPGATMGCWTMTVALWFNQAAYRALERLANSDKVARARWAAHHLQRDRESQAKRLNRRDCAQLFLLVNVFEKQKGLYSVTQDVLAEILSHFTVNLSRPISQLIICSSRSRSGTLLRRPCVFSDKGTVRSLSHVNAYFRAVCLPLLWSQVMVVDDVPKRLKTLTGGLSSHLTSLKVRLQHDVTALSSGKSEYEPQWALSFTSVLRSAVQLRTLDIDFCPSLAAAWLYPVQVQKVSTSATHLAVRLKKDPRDTTPSFWWTTLARLLKVCVSIEAVELRCDEGIQQLRPLDPIASEFADALFRRCQSVQVSGLPALSRGGLLRSYAEAGENVEQEAPSATWSFRCRHLSLQSCRLKYHQTWMAPHFAQLETLSLVHVRFPLELSWEAFPTLPSLRRLT